MDFDLGKRERAFCEKIRALFRSELQDAAGDLGQKDPERARSATLRCLRILARVGYLALGLTDGRNSVPLTAAREELASAFPRLFLSVETGTRVFGWLLVRYGTEGQKRRFLPPLEKGEHIGAIAVSEATANVEDNPFQTSARPSGRSYVLQGKKGSVLNASIADTLAVAAALETKYGFFLVQRENPGVSSISRLSTLGLEQVRFASVSLKDCRVGDQDLVGPFEKKGVLREIRAWEDEILTVAALGLMQRAFRASKTFAKEHCSGGRAIIGYQEVGFKLADILTLLQTAQLLAYRAAWFSQAEDKEAPALRHCAKVFCTESAEKVASESLQIMGARGYLRGNPVEEAFRDSKFLEIAGTSTEISRMKIGDFLLK